MERRTASRLAILAAGVPTVLALATALLSIGFGTELQTQDGTDDVVSAALLPVSFVVAGLLIARRLPNNPVGWLAIGTAFFMSLGIFMDTYAVRVIARPGTLPLAGLAAWIQTWAFIPLYLTLGHLLLRFPTGAPGPGARWLAPALTVAVAATAGLSAFSAPVDYLQQAPNPLAVEGRAGDVLLAILAVMAGVIAILLLACVVSLLLRGRRAQGDERQQIKTLGFGAVILLVGVVTAILDIGGGVGWMALMAVPIAIGVAILRFRLYDIDVVIGKTLVYGSLAAFIGAVYVAVVVGIGQVVGAGDEPNLALSIAATAIVAVAFHPLRERLQRLANRLVYGERATPYEVLSGFSERVAGTYATEDVLARMAQIVAQGIGAARADVWLRVGDQLVPAASWPGGDGGRAGRLRVAEEELLGIEGVDRAIPVRHRGELLGALAVTKRPGETITPADERLLADLASQAGLVLRNVRLTAELQARLEELSRQAEELRMSRQRIVETQDAERRRLERNIHDGAQQHLVALAVKLRLARTMLGRDPGRARILVGQLRRETREALETLRDLARGIYPPLLAEKGPAKALRGLSGRLGLPLEIRDETGRRYPPDIEVASYFSSLEALQNVAKHANATRVVVRFRETDGAIEFSVADDGAGFDPERVAGGSGLRNLADRVEALGGTLRVDSAPGRGTEVTGRIPVRTPEAVSP